MLRAAFAGGLIVAAMVPKRIQMTQPAGPYRIELNLLLAEPFVSAAAAASGAVTEGMVALGGAAPVPPSAANHHLVAHVFDRLSGHALTHADVRIRYRHGGSSLAFAVPIVRMEAVGKGPQSTHYGNNVRLRPGDYYITVTANGHSATFHLTLNPSTTTSNGAMI